MVIPVYRPGKEFRKLIERLQRQTYRIDHIIIMNTISEGYPFPDLRKPGVKDPAEIIVKDLSKNEFNHGLTRNAGFSLSEAEFVICMTQDAIPENDDLVKELVKPFEDEDVVVTYARQLPRKDCRQVEQYVRSFNYPDYDIVKTKETFDTLGIKNIFCSDVCAAYRREFHKQAGGFCETDFNEDMIFAYHAIIQGKKVYYASGARVLHSHNYSYLEQFKRNREIGRSQRKHSDVFGNLKSEDEGIRMLKNGIRHFHDERKDYLIPDFILSSGFKFLGFQIGKQLKHSKKNKKTLGIF